MLINYDGGVSDQLESMERYRARTRSRTADLEPYIRSVLAVCTQTVVRLYCIRGAAQWLGCLINYL